MDDLLRRSYELLGLGEGASLEEVHRAYRNMVERHGEDWERVKEINEAYEILLARLDSEKAGDGKVSGETGADGWRQKLFAHLLPHEGARGAVLAVRVAFFVALACWGVRFMSMPLQGGAQNASFMHLINLPFHEAGHVIFSLLGSFMTVLGGTLMQLLVPLVCIFAFLKREDPFGASFGLWWEGQSLLDVAPYIYDARAGELILLGGITGQEAPDFHDWHNILSRLGLLAWDHGLAIGAKITGILLMLLTLVWMATIILNLYRRSAFKKD